MSQITNVIQNSGPGGYIQTITGNTGGAVPPSAGNINVIGDGTTITVTGNPGTSTLTISVIGGSDVQSIAGDSGSAVSGNVLILGRGTVTPTTLANSGLVFTGDGVHTLSAMVNYINMSNTNSGTGFGALYIDDQSFLSATGGFATGNISLGIGATSSNTNSIAIGHLAITSAASAMAI